MKKTILAAALASLLLSGCGNPSLPAGAGGTAEAPPPGSEWELVAGEAADGPLETSPRHPITLEFFEDRPGDENAGGVAACNHYGARAAIDGSDVSIRAISMTEMACEPARIMELERRYIEALERVEVIEMDDDSLTLTGPETRLVFRYLEPPPTPELVDTEWQLDSLIEGAGPDGLVGEARPGGTLILHADGSLEADTGCSPLTGRWVERGGHIAITEMASPEDCTGPKSDQDAHVKSVLASFRVELDQTLMLFNERQAIGLIYRQP